jgi:hypothetical protein
MIKLFFIIFTTFSLYAYPRPNWNQNACEIGKCQYNTRYCILIENGKNLKFDGCKLISGVWYSFYTNKEIKSPSEIDIDHVFPSSLMYQGGLRDDKFKKAFNDIENLVISSSRENRQKSDSIEIPFTISEEKKQEVKEIQKNTCNKYKLNNCNSIK